MQFSSLNTTFNNLIFALMDDGEVFEFSQTDVRSDLRNELKASNSDPQEKISV